LGKKELKEEDRTTICEIKEVANLAVLAVGRPGKRKRVPMEQKAEAKAYISSGGSPCARKGRKKSQGRRQPSRQARGLKPGDDEG